MNECFTLTVRLACDSQLHERLMRIRYWFTSNHIPFSFSCRPREASRLEAKTHEAEAKARFSSLEAEARPRGLTSLRSGYNIPSQSHHLIYVAPGKWNILSSVTMANVKWNMPWTSFSCLGWLSGLSPLSENCLCSLNILDWRKCVCLCDWLTQLWK